MNNFIDLITKELEALKSIDFKKINAEHRKMLKEKYNLYTAGFKFGEDDWGNIIFLVSDETLANLKYLVGLEYDEECIEYQFKMNGKNLISYSGSDRAEKLCKDLMEVE